VSEVLSFYYRTLLFLTKSRPSKYNRVFKTNTGNSGVILAWKPGSWARVWKLRDRGS